MGQIFPSQPNSPCPLLLLQNGPLWPTLIPWPNNHLVCVGWKEVYKTLHFSSHFRCGINVKGFKKKKLACCCNKGANNLSTMLWLCLCKNLIGTTI